MIKGTGLQGIGAFVTSTGYFAIGIPVSLIGVFVYDLKVMGLWIGPTVATIFNTCCYNIIIRKIDWHELTMEVGERHNLEDKMQ